jgi:ribosome biogenesis GTPase A
MLWPNLENPNTGYRLATTGAIKDTALKHDDIASFAGATLGIPIIKACMTLVFSAL